MTQSIQQITQQIDALMIKYDRPDQNVKLLAVSKTRSAAEIEMLVKQGQQSFGENYLQEAIDKIQQLQAQSLEWHYIGKIQSNKTRPIAAHFDWVHTVDRLKIAQRLNEHRMEQNTPLNVCIQVNTSGEASKGGVELDELADLAQAVKNLPHLKLRGLMTLPAPENDLQPQREAFQPLKTAFDQFNHDGFELDTLSMGTSNDFEAAIAEGSTIVRIGTALFGARQY